MILAAHNWKKIRVLTLFVMASAIHRNGKDGIVFEDISDCNLNHLVQDGNVQKVAFCNCPLNKISLGLGRLYPNAERARFVGMCESDASPTEEDIKKGALSAGIKNLEMNFPTSLIDFEWTKLLFPEATSLCINLESLPTRPPGSPLQLKYSATENIARLQVTGEEVTSFPIFESLKLFTSVKKLHLFDISVSVLEDTRGNDLVLHSVEVLTTCKIPASRAFLNKVPAMFPSLKRLHTDYCVVQDMTSGTSTTPSYATLKTLSVSCLSSEFVFGERFTKVFPALSKLKIYSSRTLELPSSMEGLTPLASMSVVRISNAHMPHPPDFFEWLFPNLDSLRIAFCEIEKLSSGVSDPYRSGEFFRHCHLKYLDISMNPGLNDSITDVAFQFPSLVFLDISKSCTRKLPHDFFRGCQLIEELRVSCDLQECHDKAEWWESLGMLSELKKLDVVIHSPSISCNIFWEQNSGEVFTQELFNSLVEKLAKTLGDVGKSLKNQPAIRVFKSYSSEVLATIQYPNQAETSPMEE